MAESAPTARRLAQLLLRSEQLQAIGKELTTEELCGDAPELAAELQRLLEVLRELETLRRQAEAATILPAPSPVQSAEPETRTPELAVDQAEAATLAPLPMQPVADGLRRGPPGYEILTELGRGGMGVVYKARQVGLNRTVALKVTLAGQHASAQMLARFQREGEAVARLQHPGIVQIHEIGVHDGQPFFSLEFVAGGSLASRLDGRPWPAEKAAELVRQLALAVQAAHEQGIVHRDLKPENILLTADEQPKITDFGVAKLVQQEQGQTRTGEVMGTPSYMAPEQAGGKKDVGPGADVYSLGAILYRLLTARPPFQAATPLDTILQVLEKEPAPIRELNPKIPRNLEAIAMKCLRKQASLRYASAEDLAGDLDRFVLGEPVRAKPMNLWQRAWSFHRRRPNAAIARVLTFGTLLSLFTLGLPFDPPIWSLFSLGTLVTLAVLFRARFRALVVAGTLLVVLLALSLGVALLAPAFVRSATESMGLAEEKTSQLAINYLAIGILVGLFYGLSSRLMAWYFEGSAVDACCGSFVGAIFGGLIGGLFFFVASTMLIFAISDRHDIVGTRMILVMALALGIALIGPLAGHALGGIMGAKSARRAAR